MTIVNFLMRLILNRNFILVFAVIMGFIFGEKAVYVKDYTMYVLAITMVFATTGIASKALWPPKKLVKPMLVGTLLNYFVFGAVVLLLAWFLMPTEQLFMGFVVVVAAPPGVAVIPFSGILKGNLDYSIVGVFGAFLASIFIAPALVGYFPGGKAIDSWALFWLMIKLVMVPLLVSRLLLMQPLFKVVEKIRGKVVDWGFAIIIFTAVGMNRDVFFSDPKILLLVSAVLLAGTFGIGSLYQIIMPRLGVRKDLITTQTLLLTIKSSGFSVVTALALFGREAAIPSAVLAVVVLMYLLFLSIRLEMRGY